MSARPGRNDLCYCGSGKKYKRCHLRIDEQAQFSSRISAAAQRSAQPLGSDADDQPGAGETGPTADESPDTLSAQGDSAGRWDEDPALLSRVAQALETGKPWPLLARDPKLRQLFKGQETWLTYMAESEEIEAAGKALTAYRPEFEKLCKDAAGYRRQSEALFAEAAFEPLRFTAEDLRRAFAEVGTPALDDASSKKTGKLLRKALLFLATEERRRELSLRLMLLLPDYVKRGRHLDAIMLESCAQMTAEDLDEPNPFLGRMFLYGLEAWAAETEASRAALLEEAGFQLGPDAAPEEVEEWLHKELADPESAARWERLLEAHPELNSTARDSQLMVRKAVDLLQREDSVRLLLGAEEIQPWEAMAVEKLRVLLEAIGPVETGRKPPKAQTKKVFNQVWLPTIQEMTKNIFTPERVGRLVAELRVYRKELADAEQKIAAMQATAAILYIEREAEPELNAFLVNVCARSVMHSDVIQRAGGLDGDEPATK